MIGSAQRIRLVWLCAPGQRTQDDSAGAEEQCPLDRYADISAAATDVDRTPRRLMSNASCHPVHGVRRQPVRCAALRRRAGCLLLRSRW